MTPTGAGQVGTGSIWGRQGVGGIPGLVHMLLPGMWAGMVSEVLLEKGGRKSLFRLFSGPSAGSHSCFSNIN